MATIRCQDCGFERHRVPSNTRYCKRCRILRDIDYWRNRTRTCATAGCSNTFAPLSRTDRWCSVCDPGLRAHVGPCALARGAHEGRYVHPALPVCAACARNPKLRRLLIQSLEAGQSARRQANAHPKEA